jgi:hypothetical protein
VANRLESFWYLHTLGDSGSVVAEGKDDPERDRIRAEPGVVSTWVEPLLEGVGDGDLGDYVVNNLGLRLCSDHMRRTVSEVLGPKNPALQWLPVRIRLSSGDEQYWALHVTDMPEVLDRSKSIVVDDKFVVKAVIDPALAEGLNVVSFPGAGVRLIVSGSVRTALIASDCRGIDFSAVPLSDARRPSRPGVEWSS